MCGIKKKPYKNKVDCRKEAIKLPIATYRTLLLACVHCLNAPATWEIQVLRLVGFSPVMGDPSCSCTWTSIMQMCRRYNVHASHVHVYTEALKLSVGRDFYWTLLQTMFR